MINEIGEALVQPSVRTDQMQVEQVKAVAQQEAEKKVYDRPVEKADEQAKAKLRAKEEKEDKSEAEYTMKGNKVVFEKYSKDGSLILQIPSVHDDEV